MAASTLGAVHAAQARQSADLEEALPLFELAEPLLVESAEALLADPKVPAGTRIAAKAADRVVALYEAWHALEPDTGHDASAREWRERLEEGGR